jgi:bacillithiol synthase
LNLEIQVRAITGSRLVDDYVREDAGLLTYFAGSPFDDDAYRLKAREVSARFDPGARRAMAEAVRPLGADASQKLAAVRDGHGFFVTTGQQPGLFGGPLFTISKALTAIALARRLEAVLDAPVLAVFWIASDDHDWEEANHVHLLDASNVLHRLTLEGDVDPTRSMGRRILGKGAESALAQLSEVLPVSEFAAPLIERIRGAYQAHRTVAAAFAETLAGLLDGLPLGLVDSQDPVVRTLASPVIERELREAGASGQALGEQTERLEAAGYGAQVPVLAGASNVFYEDDVHGRERLLREDGEWVFRASGRRQSDQALLELWAAEPARFSPNVVLRPVVESAVFPTLAYVGGPGEVRYLAQTGQLFERHGVGMPLVYPRLSVTLVESKVRKVLDKFGLEVESFRHPVQELISAAVHADVPDEVRSAVLSLREAVQQGYQEIHEAAIAVDPTLKSPVFAARNEALRGLAEVEKKVRQHVKSRRETELEQIEKASANLAPLGKPQERVLNVHQYLARYGDELIGAILAAVEAEVMVGVRNRAAL